MADIDFQKLIEDISYGQENYQLAPVFALTPEKYLIVTEGSDEVTIIQHISSYKGFDTRGDGDFFNLVDRFSVALNATDAQIGEYINALRDFSSPTFIYDYVKNSKENVSSISIVKTQNSFFNVVSFRTALKIRVIETGIGKDLLWCKVLFQVLTDSGIKEQTGFCLKSDIAEGTYPDSRRLIDYSDVAKSPTINPKLYAKSVNFTVFPSDDFDKVNYSDEIASYYVITQLNIVDFNNLTEEIITDSFKSAFSSAIKAILKDVNKLQTKDGRNFEEQYYCFAKIESYVINPRRNQPPAILVVLPYRNVEAVCKTDNYLQAAGQSLLDLPDLVNRASETISNTEIFNFNKLAPNLSSVLSAGSSNAANYDYSAAISDGLDSAINGEPSLRDYISPSDIPTFKELPSLDENDPTKENPNQVNRFVFIPYSAQPNGDLVLLKTFDNVYKTLKDYASKLRGELEKDPPPEVFIDLSLYEDSYNNFTNTIIGLLNQNAGKLLGLYDENGLTLNTALTFKFISINDIMVVKAIYISYNGGKNIIELDGVNSLLINEPITDSTFAFLLANTNALAKEDGKKSITSFLSDYVIPGELAQIKYAPGTADRFEQRELECLRTYVDNTKDQLKQSTNEFINNIVSGESIKNFQQTFSEKEWEELGKQLGEITKQNWEEFIDPKTIQWELIIDEVTKCIANQQLRDATRFLLNAIKNFLVNDVPLACQIPQLPIPSFPVIKIPTFPNIPGMMTVYYNSFGEALAEERTDAILTLLRMMNDVISSCKDSIDPDTVGDTSPEDLLGDYSNSGQALGQTGDALENAGIVRNDEENKEESKDEVKKILDSVSKSLTKSELIKLFLGTADNEIIRIVKNEINLLESKQGTPQGIKYIPKKLGSSTKKFNNYDVTILADNKVKEFFARFAPLMNQEKLNFLTEQILSNDPDILCIDNNTFNENLKKALKEKGLTEEQAQVEVERKDQNLKNTISKLSLALNMLNKTSIELKPINCVQNEDGTITPGISDKIGIPEAFKISNEDILDKLYSKFDESYNQDIKNWFRNSSITIQDKSGNVIKKLFLTSGSANTFYASVVYPTTVKRTSSFRGIVSSPFPDVIDLNFKIPEYLFATEENAKLINEDPDSQFSKLLVETNNININTKIRINASTSSISGTGLDLSYNSLNATRISTISDQENRIINLNKSLSNNYNFSTSSYSVQANQNLLSLIGGINTEIQSKQDAYDKKIVNYLFQKQFFNNFLFEYKTDKNGNLQTPNIQKALSLDLNPLLTKKEKKCGVKDKRLINLDEIKNSVQKAAAKSACLPPIMSLDGKKKVPSAADTANYEAGLALFFRIYSIDFNLKLLPFGNYLSLLDSEVFYVICYDFIMKDIKRLFGSSYASKINKIMMEKYKREQNLKDIKIEDLLNSKADILNAFKMHFKKDFSSVSTQIHEIYKNEKNKNIVKITKSEEIIQEKNYKSFVDYAYDNITLIPDPASISNVKNSLNKEISLITNNDIMARIKNIFDFLISKPSLEILLKEYDNKIKPPGWSLDQVRIFLAALVSSDSMTEEDLKNILNYIINLLKEYGDSNSNYFSNVDKFYENNEYSLKPSYDRINDLLIESDNDDNLSLVTKEGLEVVTQIKTFSDRIKEKQQLIEKVDVDLDKLAATNPPFCIITNNGRSYFSMVAKETKKYTDFFTSDIESLYTFAITSNESYKKDLTFKDLFYTYFKLYYPFDEMFSGYCSTMLLSLNSLDVLNSSFDASKQEIKSIIDIIDLASDYTKKIEDNGVTASISKLKVLAALPKTIVRSFAQITDPNISIASAVSTAYGLGVAQAEAAGVQISVKNLPMYIPSLGLSAALLPPITPQGQAAFAISLAEDDFGMETDSTTNDDDVC